MIRIFSDTADEHSSATEEEVKYFSKSIWLVTKIHREILANSANMQALINKCQKGQLATKELAELTNFEDLYKIEPKQTRLLSIENPEHDASLEFKFRVDPMLESTSNEENNVSYHDSMYILIICAISITINIVIACLFIRSTRVPPVPDRTYSLPRLNENNID